MLKYTYWPKRHLGLHLHLTSTRVASVEATTCCSGPSVWIITTSTPGCTCSSIYAQVRLDTDTLLVITRYPGTTRISVCFFLNKLLVPFLKDKFLLLIWHF